MITSAQQEARLKNWKILQLRGMQATLKNFNTELDANYRAIEEIDRLLIELGVSTFNEHYRSSK